MSLRRRTPLSSSPEKRRHFIRRGQQSSAEWSRRSRSYLSRKKGLKRRNVERLHRKRGGGPEDPERHTYGERFRFVSRLPCCVCGTIDGAPAEHWKTVGSGGRDEDCIPVCVRHTTKDRIGQETWRARHNVDVEAVLEGVEEVWQEKGAA